MTQARQAQEQPPHPFDLEKSDFEKLLDRDYNLKAIDDTVADAAEAMTMDHMKRAIYLARAQDHLRKELDNLEWVIMPLMGTRMGFKTDKKITQGPNGPNYPYTWDVVRDCVLEGLLAGANLTGNEMNIISGNPYLTREFFYRKVQEEVENGNLQNFIESPAVPRVQGTSAVVVYNAKGSYKGRPFDYTREIPIRVNEGQGPDAILGKAQRKFFKWLLETLLRISFGTDGETGDTDTATFVSPSNNSRVAEAAVATAQAQQPRREPPPAPKLTPPAPPAAPAQTGPGPASTPPQQARRPGPAKPAPVAPPAAVEVPVELTPDERAMEMSENVAESDLLPTLQACDPKELDKAKRNARMQGVIDEFSVQQQRDVYFHVLRLQFMAK